jgi:hypothetical protein
MYYDPQLAELLGAIVTTAEAGEVFRATRVDADPTASSLYGGRWAWPQNGHPGTPVLYTSKKRDGAMAEMASFLASLTPVPGPRPIKVSRLQVSTAKTVRLTRNDLLALKVDLNRYGERDYVRTQEIGSTLAWLGVDGLIAPSARWDCDNLMIFTEQHNYNERLEVIDHEIIEWRDWAYDNGIIAARR